MISLGPITALWELSWISAIAKIVAVVQNRSGFPSAVLAQITLEKRR
jgi:hypothetical protein